MANQALDLEKTPEFFYDRLRPGEANFVKKTLGELKSYLDNKHLPDYLVSGVGGILRRKDPKSASDIDLAVVGLKYLEDYHFDNVISFTKTVGNFFLQLGDQMTHVKSLDGGSSAYRGSGPFARWSESVEAKIGETKVLAESQLESFGLYDSKGMLLRYGNSRPIDVQFVFNKSINDWLCDQRNPNQRYMMATESKGISSPFFYSILLKKE